MKEIITTQSIGKGIAEIEEDFILCEEPMSRLVFRAQIHDKGIRGKIIRQRRDSKEDSWVPDEAIDIRTLGKKESINLDINTEALEKLYAAILKLKKILESSGVEYGETEYIVVDPEAVVITEENKAVYINKIIDAGYTEEVWKTLAETSPSLTTKLSHARIQEEKQKVIKTLKKRLKSKTHHETKGKDSWQKWIYENNWLFGVNYKNPIEKTKINITGAMPDFLFPTLDGFVDILEIKLPNDDVILADKSHPGSWKWTPETNSAIGQVVNYLNEIDRLRLELEKEVKTKYDIEISFLKPRAHILIGDSSDWSTEKKDALRKLNHCLHGVMVLTYKDLQDRGRQAVSLGLEET